ncbi:MAG: 50S ribosomal protein L18 [Gammaproteobacteria bacterium]|jgi:large subunit ribosomal protein L18
MKNSKILSRKRRSKKTRAIQRRLNQVRLCVHKTPKHIYAQVIVLGDDGLSTVVGTASTLSPSLREELKYTGNVEAAEKVGAEIAKVAIAAGYTKVAFDRSGFIYHGRIKALADKAREAGLQF